MIVLFDKRISRGKTWKIDLVEFTDVKRGQFKIPETVPERTECLKLRTLSNEVNE